MAEMGMKDIVLGKDLLSEHDMKPWWESFHGYLLGGSLTLAILLSYLLSATGVVNCLPDGPSNNSVEFSETQAALTNGYCVSQIPWYASYSGLICTSMATIILVSSNLWLSHPGVINGFRIFSRIEGMVHQLHSSPEKLKVLAVSPLFTNDEEPVLLRKVCLLLWSYNTPIYKIYQVRNAVVIILTLMAAFVSSGLAYFSFTLIVKPTFTCFVSYDPTKFESLHGHQEFLCSYNVSTRIFPIVAIFSLTIFMQAAVLIIGALRVRTVISCDGDSSKNRSNDFKIARKYSQFMIFFWKNSHPFDSDAFASLIEFIFSDETVTAMGGYIKKAVTNKIISSQPMKPATPNPDLTYVTLFSKIHRDGGNHIISALNEIFEERNGRKEIDDICEALTCFKFSTWDKEADNFLGAAIDKRYWLLVVRILNATSQGLLPRMVNHKLSLDVLDHAGNNRNSFLYYALQKDKAFDAFNRNALEYALNCHRPRRESREYFVHFEGKSLPVMEFIKNQCHPMTPDLLKLIKEREADWEKPFLASLCETEFNRLFDIYTSFVKKEMTDSEEQNPHSRKIPKNFKELENVQTQAARLKFYRWSENLKKFARLSAEMKHWKLFVMLLDSKVVNCKHVCPLTKPDPENCGFTEFQIDNPSQHTDWNGRTILHYIINDRGGLCEPSFTGFRHILSCIWGTKTRVRERNHSVTLSEYVKSSNLSVTHKRTLIAWIDNCEKGAPDYNGCRDEDVDWPK